MEQGSEKMAYAENIPRVGTLVRAEDVSGLHKDILFGVDWKNITPQPEKDAIVTLHGKENNIFTMSAARLSRMTLLVGGNGTGKTNVFLFAIRDICRAMHSDDFVLIFDSKGDFFDHFYRKEDIVVGANSTYRNQTRYWNIYNELRNEQGMFDEESELLAKELLKQLGEEYKKTTQPFFPMAAIEVIACVVISFIRQARKTGDETRLNNQGLVRFLRRAQLKDYNKILQTPGNEDMSAVSIYLGTMQEKQSNQALGVLSYVHQIIDDLFVGVFGGKGETRVQEFSMRRLVRERGGKTMFLEYDLTRGELLTPVYKVLVDLALKEAMGRQRSAGDFYLIADEARLMPNLMHLQDAVNFGRSLGVKVMIGLQAIGQLEDAYGKCRGNVISGGFTNCFCFNTPDAETRQFISNRFGKALYHYDYRIRGKQQEEFREGYAVEDWDIMQLHTGEAFIALADCDPFRFSFARYEDF